MWSTRVARDAEKDLSVMAAIETNSFTTTHTLVSSIFHTQNAKTKNTKQQPTAPGKSDEVVALLRVTQIIASGGEVDIVDFIGNHECSKIPQSLFNGDGTMRSACAKANLVKTLKEETKVVSSPCLPKEHRKTAVVVYAIRRWTFHKEEPFGSIATRYRNNLIQDVPAGTSIIYFC